MKKTSKLLIVLTLVLALTLGLAACGSDEPKGKDFYLPASLELKVGENKTIPLTNTTGEKTVIWTSKADSVATVSNGVVTGVAPGVTTVTAKAGSYESTCTITVKGDALNMSVAKKSMKVGATTTLSVTTDATGTVSWESSDESVVTFEPNGKSVTLTAVDVGSAVVTATLGKLSSTCEVTVTQEAAANGEIRTVADFKAISSNLSGSYKLMQDIDFENIGINPIGNWESGKAFTGTFDGQGFALINVTIKEIKNAEGAAFGSSLFAKIGAKGVVKNLNVIDITATGVGFSGAIAGESAGTISNCFVRPKLISCTNGAPEDWNVRGGNIVGINGLGGTIENCFVYYDDAQWHNVFMMASWNWGSVKNSYAVDTTVRAAGTEIKLVNPNDDKPDDGTVSVNPADASCKLLTVETGKLSASYTGLSADNWVKEDGKIPYLKTEAGTVRNWGTK